MSASASGRESSVCPAAPLLEPRVPQQRSRAEERNLPEHVPGEHPHIDPGAVRQLRQELCDRAHIRVGRLQQRPEDPVQRRKAEDPLTGHKEMQQSKAESLRRDIARALLRARRLERLHNLLNLGLDETALCHIVPEGLRNPMPDREAARAQDIPVSEDKVRGRG
jgi:hypothetical protein